MIMFLDTDERQPSNGAVVTFLRFFLAPSTNVMHHLLTYLLTYLLQRREVCCC